MARPVISAHAGYPRLLDSGADFIEIDVRRTAGGLIVDSHDEVMVGARPAALDEILAAIAGRGLGIHLDLKEAGYERELIGRSLEWLPADKIVATPDFAESVRTIKQSFPDIRVSPIDFIALDQKDASEARLEGAAVPVWVWTVDDERLMRRFIADPRVGGLITNRPDRALRIRKGRS